MTHYLSEINILGQKIKCKILLEMGSKIYKKKNTYGKPKKKKIISSIYRNALIYESK